MLLLLMGDHHHCKSKSKSLPLSVLCVDENVFRVFIVIQVLLTHSSLGRVIPTTSTYKTTRTSTKPGNATSSVGEDGFHFISGYSAAQSMLGEQEDDVTTTKGPRVKRFAYEDEHKWPDDDNMDYDLDDEGDEDDLSLADRIGKHWQTVAVRGLFCLVGVCMLVFICCCCGTVCCRVCCHSLRQNCVPCAGFLKFVSAYYEDPMYTRAKEMAVMFGLKLDYDTFLKIKDRFDMGSEGPYNPLGLPHME